MIKKINDLFKTINQTEIIYIISGFEAINQAQELGLKISGNLNPERTYYFETKNNKLIPYRGWETVLTEAQKEENKKAKAKLKQIKREILKNPTDFEEIERLKQEEKKKYPLGKFNGPKRPEYRGIHTHVQVSIDINFSFLGLDNEYPETEEELLQKRRDTWL